MDEIVRKMDVATGDISRFQPVQNNHCEQIAALIGNETAEHTEKARIKAAGKAEKRAAKAAANVAPGRSRFLRERTTWCADTVYHRTLGLRGYYPVN